jgi:endonuclease/exonuclease/phosphatase (EEP) superfamily protein YafD
MPFKRLLPEVFGAADPLVLMGKAGERALGGTISVLVWNIYKAKKSGWRNDFLKLIKNRDLVLLQESVFNTPHDGIFEKSRYFEWVMARSHEYRRNRIVTGLKTGAVAPSIAQEFLRSPDQEPFLKTPKLVLATKYPLKDSQKALLVLNVHAINFVSFKKYARYIDQVLPVMRQHSGPIILAGDFNCWNAARSEFLFRWMKDEGLAAAEPDRKARWRHLNRHLDHIFYRDLQLTKAETLSDIDSSDHYPIAAEFKELSA